MVVKKILPLVIGYIITLTELLGQIYAPAANASFSAAYNPVGGTDSVFIFNRSLYQSPVTASIVAESVDKTTGWTFEWSVYDPVAGVYNVLPVTSGGWFSEIDTITVSSGYRVEITKGAVTDIFRVWVVINDFNVEITNKDAEDKLLFGYYNCSSLDLRSDTTMTPLIYYDPGDNSIQKCTFTLTVRWTTDNSAASDPANFLNTRVYDPPSSDTWYYLKVTDGYTLIREDSVFYESIQSEAKLNATYINLSDTSEYPNSNYGNYYSNGIKSAPGKYRFDVSASENMAGYILDFGDGYVLQSGIDTLIRVHEYTRPGDYKAVLTTKSDIPYECIDSVSVIADLAYADNMNFALPNVFSPNSDGDNDVFTMHENNVFRSADVSVLSIDISIFDRAGRLVHEYSGNIRDWKGWDGLIKNSNRQAPEGVYFYVITLLSAWEDTGNPVGKDVMKGFFHLFRE